MSVVYEDRAVRLVKFCLRRVANGEYPTHFDGNHQCLAELTLGFIEEGVKTLDELLYGPTDSLLYFIRAVIFELMRDQEFHRRPDIEEHDVIILETVATRLDKELDDTTFQSKQTININRPQNRS